MSNDTFGLSCSSSTDETFGFDDEYIEYKYVDLNQKLKKSEEEKDNEKIENLICILIMRRISLIPSIFEEYDDSGGISNSEERTEFEQTTLNRTVQLSDAKRRRRIKIIDIAECEDEYLKNQVENIHLVNDYDPSNLQSLSIVKPRNIDFIPASHSVRY